MRWILRLSETHCIRWARVTSDTCGCCSLNEFLVEMISNYFSFSFLCWIYISSDEIFHTETHFSTTTQIVRNINLKLPKHCATGCQHTNCLSSPHFFPKQCPSFQMEVYIHPWLVSIVLRIKLQCGNFYHQAYLEGFHKFCEDLGGTTADVMCPILQVSEIFL